MQLLLSNKSRQMELYLRRFCLILLFIQMLPSLATTQNKNISAVVGGNATLFDNLPNGTDITVDCETEKGELFFAWRGGGVVSDSKHSLYPVQTLVQVNGSWSMILLNVKKIHTGRYTCEERFGSGNDTVNTHLTVLDKNISAVVGGNATLFDNLPNGTDITVDCETEKGVLFFAWRDGSVVSDSKHSLYPVQTLAQVNGSWSMILLDLKKIHTGRYTCEERFGSGNDTVNTYLTVLDGKGQPAGEAEKLNNEGRTASYEKGVALDTIHKVWIPVAVVLYIVLIVGLSCCVKRFSEVKTELHPRCCRQTVPTADRHDMGAKYDPVSNGRTFYRPPEPRASTCTTEM